MMNLSENIASLCGMATNAASAAKKKATVLAGIAKANVAIYAEEDKVRKAEAELGRLYYNDTVAGAETTGEAYELICKRISDSKEVIAALKETVAQLKTRSGEAAEEEVAVEVAEGDCVADETDFAAPEEHTSEAPEAPEKAPEEPAE